MAYTKLSAQDGHTRYDAARDGYIQDGIVVADAAAVAAGVAATAASVAATAARVIGTNGAVLTSAAAIAADTALTGTFVKGEVHTALGAVDPTKKVIVVLDGAGNIDDILIVVVP